MMTEGGREKSAPTKNAAAAHLSLSLLPPLIESVAADAPTIVGGLGPSYRL